MKNFWKVKFSWLHVTTKIKRVEISSAAYADICQRVTLQLTRVPSMFVFNYSFSCVNFRGWNRPRNLFNSENFPTDGMPACKNINEELYIILATQS